MRESPIADMSRLSASVEGNSLLAEIRRLSDAGSGIWLVGGAVRDGLIGASIADLDLVTEGDAAGLARTLAEDALIHERFGTAEVMVDGTRVDVANARSESYDHPGALPEVGPATLTEDLGRRDFTINSIAVAITDPETLIDPHGGLADLERGVLRVLHPDSFSDDPTRALRAARYAARFGFDLEPRTADLLESVDLASVSRERVDREFELIADEPTGVEAFRLLSVWGLVEIPPDRLEMAAVGVELVESKVWRGRAGRGEATLEILFGDPFDLPLEAPNSPYRAVRAATGLTPAELLAARAAGALWLDRYVEEWSSVRPSITGDDLVLAGLPQGPAIGVGLDAALRARLDDGVEGIEDELVIAVAAAERSLE